MLDRLANVLEGDFVRDLGFARRGEEDELDFAAAEFLVAAEFVHDGVGADGVGQGEGKLENMEQPENASALYWREAVYFFREEEGGAGVHAEDLVELALAEPAHGVGP